MTSRGLAIAALAVICAHAGGARADVRVAIRNDAFTELVPPVDDSGFTQDVEVAFWRPRGRYLIGGALWWRWITEVGGPRRWDQLDVVATVERAWGAHVQVGARLGPTLGGNLGGRATQNWWHSVSGTGVTLDHGLQRQYPGGHTVGVLAGAHARATIGTAVQGYAVVDGQVAVGETGVTSIEAATGGRVITTYRCVELGAHGELAVARYHVADANLALPGGYGVDRWEPAWRVGVHVAWGRVRIDYEYRANEGGSGEPIGVVAVTIKQDGAPPYGAVTATR